MTCGSRLSTTPGLGISPPNSQSVSNLTRCVFVAVKSAPCSFIVISPILYVGRFKIGCLTRLACLSQANLHGANLHLLLAARRPAAGLSKCSANTHRSDSGRVQGHSPAAAAAAKVVQTFDGPTFRVSPREHPRWVLVEGLKVGAGMSSFGLLAQPRGCVRDWPSNRRTTYRGPRGGSRPKHASHPSR